MAWQAARRPGYKSTSSGGLYTHCTTPSSGRTRPDFFLKKRGHDSTSLINYGKRHVWLRQKLLQILYASPRSTLFISASYQCTGLPDGRRTHAKHTVLWSAKHEDRNSNKKTNSKFGNSPNIGQRMIKKFQGKKNTRRRSYTMWSQAKGRVCPASACADTPYEVSSHAETGSHYFTFRYDGVEASGYHH